MRHEALLKTTRGAAGNAPANHDDPSTVIQIIPACPGWAALLGDDPSGPRRIPVELWGLTADGLAVPMVMVSESLGLLEDATGHPNFLSLCAPEALNRQQHPTPSAEARGLEVCDLAARVRLALWGLVEERPDRLAILREATSRALGQAEAEAQRRGMDRFDELQAGHHAA